MADSVLISVVVPTYNRKESLRQVLHAMERQSLSPDRFEVILICEDFWHASPPYLLWLDGADLFLFTSASPRRGLSQQPQMESARWVDHINRAYASLFTAFVAHANRVGYEDGLNFWGGSTLFDPMGIYSPKAPTTRKRGP